MKKNVLFFVIMTCLFGSIYAGGSKDIDELEMTSKESWQQSI